MRINQTFLVLICVFLLSLNVAAQQVAFNAFDIAPPTLMDSLKILKASNQALSPDEFAARANELLDQKGLPFTFIFDDRICDSISKAIAQLKDKDAPKNLRTRLSSVGGEPAELRLPPAEFSNTQCAKCTITLPVFEVTETHFIALLRGVKIKFERPAGLNFSETFLVDEKNTSEVKTKWRLPFRGIPLGASYDGSVLYMGLGDPRFDDLVLMVFSEGVFQFTIRNDPSLSGKGELIKQPAGSGHSLMKFKNHDIVQVIRYNEPCGN